MVKSKQAQKDALECLRLEADCKLLAAAVRRKDLQSHFTRMAQAWNQRARTRLDKSAAGPKLRSVFHVE